MTLQQRPLWQLLLTSRNDENEAPLSCADCFAILEYLADFGANGQDRKQLIRQARHHLHRCTDCQSYYLEKLNELQAMANGRGLKQ